MDAEALEKHEALAATGSAQGTMSPNAVVLGEKWGLADAAELPLAQPPVKPNSKDVPASNFGEPPIDPNSPGIPADAWLDGKKVWDMTLDEVYGPETYIWGEPKKKAAK